MPFKVKKIKIALALILRTLDSLRSFHSSLPSSFSPKYPIRLSFFALKYIGILSIAIWYTIMRKIEIRCHKNQKSSFFTYDVLGSSSLIAFISVTITRRDVPDPINLSLGFATSINKVEYPNNHKTKEGTNVVSNWLWKIRTIGIVNVNMAYSFVWLIVYRISHSC